MRFSYEDLKVWQEAMELIEKIYRITRNFPSSERFGIVSQLQRSAVSIALNIAEGKGRYHRKEYKQFLYNARGSLYETNTIVLLSMRLGYLKEKEYQELVQKIALIMSQLSGLINYLKED